MLDFKGLETFYWVSTLRSFHGAARRLHTTQPTVSQRISQLEVDLDTKLFLREGRSTMPTPQARELLVYAEKLLSLRTEMLAALSNTNGIQGVVRLGVSETIVHTWLSRFIRKVDAVHPNLALEIEVDISPNLRDRLLRHELDLAFLIGEVPGAAAHNLPLCTYPMAFIASPHLALPPGSVTLHDIAQFPLITFSRQTQPHAALLHLFDRPDMPDLRLHASASLSTIVRMAIDGLGVAFITPEIVENELRSAKLRIVETTVVVSGMAFYASWLERPDWRATADLAGIAADLTATLR